MRVHRFAVLFCLATGCVTTKAVEDEATAPTEASSPAPAPDTGEASAEAEAFDLKEARSRELAPLPKQRVSPPSGQFTGEVEGSGAPRYERSEGTTSLSVPLGSASELMCFVYDNPIDPGGALLTVANAVAGDANLKVERVRLTGIVESGGVPAVFLDVEYLTPGKGGMLAGQVKLMVRTSEHLPVLCAHDQPGYVQSFRRISLGLANSLVAPGPRPAAPRYSEIQLVRLNGHPAGFEWWEMHDEEGGQRLSTNTRLMMVPRSPTQLTAEDTSSSTTSDAGGLTQGLTYAHARDGAISLQVSVRRKADGSYSYEGEKDGQPLRGTFRSTRGLVNELNTAEEVREQLLTGKTQQLSFDFYMPRRDPTKPTEVVYSAVAGAPHTVRVTSGDTSFTGTTDSRGLIEKVEMPLPGSSVQMTVERIYVRGEP